MKRWRLEIPPRDALRKLYELIGGVTHPSGML